jgi:hypothetical protein
VGIQTARSIHSALAWASINFFYFDSALTTIKFWEDTSSVSNVQVARTFGYSTEDVNIMESRFLKGLDFTLYLNFERIHQFMLVNGELMKTDIASRQICNEKEICTEKEPYFRKETPSVVC